MRALALLCTLALPGCGSFGPPQNSPQDYAGCTFVEYRLLDGSVVNWRDCKDKSMVKVKMTMPNGVEFSYNANDVTGFEQMRLRAEVHQALTAAGVDVTSDMIDAVIGLISPLKERIP